MRLPPMVASARLARRAASGAPRTRGRFARRRAAPRLMRTGCASPLSAGSSARNGAGDGVGSRLRVSVLGDERGQVGDVCAHLCDRERDRSGSLERDTEGRVPPWARAVREAGTRRRVSRRPRRQPGRAARPGNAGTPPVRSRRPRAIRRPSCGRTWPSRPTPSATAIAADDPPAGAGTLRTRRHRERPSRRRRDVVGVQHAGNSDPSGVGLLLGRSRRLSASTNCGSGSCWPSAARAASRSAMSARRKRSSACARSMMSSRPRRAYGKFLGGPNLRRRPQQPEEVRDPALRRMRSPASGCAGAGFHRRRVRRAGASDSVRSGSRPSRTEIPTPLRSVR